MSKETSSAPSISDSALRKSSDFENLGEREKELNGAVPESTPEVISPWHPSQFPDGGRDAWLCLLGVSAPSLDHIVLTHSMASHSAVYSAPSDG